MQHPLLQDRQLQDRQLQDRQLQDQSHPVVIDFSHQTSPFEQLWPTTHRALLPVIGKPIIVHTLERLRNQGYRHFRIARHLQQPFVKNRLGSGEEWGVTLRYSDLPGPELLNETVACFGSTLQILGDELLESLSGLPLASSSTQIDGQKIPKATGFFEVSGQSLNFRRLQAESSMCSAIRSVQDYHRICFELCASFTVVETAPGASLHRSAQADWKTSIAADALIGSRCFVGKHCKIDAGAILEENCVLGNGVYIDKKSRLKNCVVLPNTYVGKGVALKDCIASPAGAIHVSGEYAGKAVRCMLRSTRPNREEITGLPCEFEKLQQG